MTEGAVGTRDGRSVTVVIPTHDRADLVARAVESVLGQSCPVAEVIVVDDASTDDTPAVLGGFGDAITVIRSEENIERAAARNLGARRAETPYVAFLDSDDEWVPEKLERQLPYLGQGVAVFTGIAFVDEAGRELGDTYAPPERARTRLPLENPYLGSPSSMVIDRQRLLDVGGFPEGRQLQGSEDWLFLLALSRSSAEMVVVEEPLVRYRLHGSNTTGDPRSLARSMWAAVDYMERGGLVAPQVAARTRARTAGVIAQSFAYAGSLDESRRWLGRAVAAGAPLEASRAGARVLATTAKRLLGRR